MLATRKPRDARVLRRHFEKADADGRPDRFHRDIQEGFAKGHMRPEDFSIRDLFEQFVPDGAELARMYNPVNRGGFQYERLVEATAVTTTMFANITGQIFYNAVMDKYDQPAFIGDKLVETVSTQLDGEKIPGIGGPGSNIQAIAESEPYPLHGVNEDWVRTPATTKHGMIVPVTKEAIFFDRTNLLLGSAGDVGNSIAIKKERNILAAVLGSTNTYNRKDGGTQATYGDTHTQGTFDNLSASTALVDWTDVEAALLLFDALTDPNTGDPISITPRQIVVPTALDFTARRVLNATSLQFGIPTSTTAVNQTMSASPLETYELITGPWVKGTTSSDTTWYIGDFPRGFKYMENWPVDVERADKDASLGFSHDIIVQFKASERGAAVAVEPRFAVKATA